MLLGIIGTGQMAERLLASLAHRPQITVTAVASATPARAAALAARLGAAACTPEGLAVRADVDAVYIASRNSAHADAALSAIAAGKPALVEKPLAATAAQTAEVIAAARSAGVLLLENLWTLALPATRALLDAPIPTTTPRVLQMEFGYPATRNSHPGLFAADAGVLRDRAGYGLALAVQLFGPVDDLTCTVRLDAGCDVAGLISLRHASGDLTSLCVAFDALLANAVTLSGPLALIRLAPSIGAEHATIQTAPPAGPTRQARFAALKSLPALSGLNRWRKAVAGRSYSYGADPYLPMLDHFAALVRDGATDSPVVPLTLSATVADLIDRARAAGGLA